MNDSSNVNANIVRDWHEALNTGNVERLVSLVHPQVEVVGPRGSTQGAEVVREWFGRANVRLIPLRFYQRENNVVVEERGEWLSHETGEITSTATVATVFAVSEGLITRIARYDSLTLALAEANLSGTDALT